jgi:uncharacterized protein (DUF362 family)
MGNPVSLVRVCNSDIGKSISDALILANYGFPTHVNSVVIKPNLCYYWDAATGQTTDPKVVSSIIDRVREEYGQDVSIKVAEADASAMRTKYAFKVLGYEKLAEQKKIELFNLSEGALEEKVVIIKNHQFHFQVSPLLLNADLFINVPKLKLMRPVKFSCAMKNIFGCIGTRRKVMYHKDLNEAVVGINKVLSPHLTIVDGLVAVGRFPIKFNLIMASADPFSIDWVAAKVMGYRPAKVRFLRLSISEKIGCPKNVIPTGEDIAELARLFPKEKTVNAGFLLRAQFSILKIYRRLSGDIIPPVFEE